VGYGGAEKRMYKRLDARVKVEISLYDPGKGKTIPQSAESLNVSAGGLLVTIERPLEVSSYVLVRFTLPGETEQHDFIARAVRVEEVEALRRYDIGLEFVDIVVGDMEKIDKYVSDELGGK
jgi:c-di-GMP-binding flagellar brake protein YcgR